jgi:hypothetical protein
MNGPYPSSPSDDRFSFHELHGHPTLPAPAIDSVKDTVYATYWIRMSEKTFSRALNG